MTQVERSVGAVASGDIEFSDYSRLPKSPLVSICVITYQHVLFIKEALDSVLMQEVDFPYEICIGEDGSTDGTREICLEYAQKHSDKIRLLLRNRLNSSRKAFKVPYMFNAATTFDACRGKYIAMLEGDDYWLNRNKLQAQVNLLESDSALAASCHYASCVDKNSIDAGNVIPEYSIDSFTVENILKKDVVNLHTSTWLLRRGGSMPWEKFYTSSFGDYAIIVWTLLRGPAKMLPKVWSAYRIHDGGVFSPLSDETRLNNNIILWECLQSISPPDLQSAVLLGIVRTLNIQTAAFLRAGKYAMAWGSFRRSLFEIHRIRISLVERNKLRLIALGHLVAPQLIGLKNRWRRKWRKSSAAVLK